MPLRFRVPVRLPDPLAADEDRTLVRRFVEAQDEAAFMGLVHRHARMVFGVCRRTVGDQHLAEDAFQAVFLVLARNPRQAVAATSVGGWLFGIARRVGLTARRHELRRQRHLTDISGNKKPDSKPDFDDLLCVLDEELAQLSATYRDPLVACFLEERTQDEAARQLGWSLSTLRRRLERGKELLRARLVSRGVTLAAGLFAGGLAPSTHAAVPSRLLDASALVAHASPLAEVLASRVVRGVLHFKAGIAAIVVGAVLGGMAAAIGYLQLDKSTEVDSAAASYEGLAPSPRSVEHVPWVTLSGQVVYPEERDLPKPRQVSPASIKDSGFFLEKGALHYNEIVIDSRTRGIANVVVWLRQDSDERNARFPSDRIHPLLARAGPVDRRIEASRDGYSPRVTAARVGDRAIFANPTPIPFNLKYQHLMIDDEGDREGDFNVLLPSGGTHIAALAQSRLPDHIQDSIHPWINAYVRVFDHPYFAVTDELGNFRIENAPAGNWRLVIWHEKAGYKNGGSGRFGERISIASRGNARQTLEPIVLNSRGWDDE